MGWALSDGGLFLLSAYPFDPFYGFAIPTAIPTVMLFEPSLLGLFGPTAYSSLSDSIWSFGLRITLLVGSFVPFISSWASLALFLNSAFPWAFTNSFGLP